MSISCEKLIEAPEFTQVRLAKNGKAVTDSYAETRGFKMVAMKEFVSRLKDAFSPMKLGLKKLNETRR